MENLTELPGDNTINTPLDPSRAELILPDNEDKVELKLPDEVSPLGEVHRNVADLDPVTTAQKIEMAKRINEPELYVDKNFDQLKKIDFSKDDGYWAKLEKEHPVVSTFLKEPKNMAVAKDDIENLKTIENTVQDKSFFVDVYDALQSGLAGMYENAARLPGLAYSVAALPQNAIANLAGRSDLEVAPYDFLLNNPVAEHYAGQKKAYAPQGSNESVTKQFQNGDYGNGARNLVLQLAINAPQQLMNIALGLSGAGLGASMLTSGSIQASGALKDSLDKGASPTSATLNAVAQGGFEAGIENMSFGTTGSIRAMKELGEALTKNLGKDAAKSAMIEFGKQVLHSFGNEALEEGATQIAQSSTAYATGVDPNALDNIGRETADAMLIGGFSGGAMTSVGVSYQKAVSARKTSRLKSMYLDLGKGINESELRKRMPEASEELITKTLAGSKVENIYLPVNAAQTYFQSKNIDLIALGKELGIEDQVKEAMETGGDIKVPLATWANKLVGTEHYEDLIDDIKFGENDFSTNEKKNHDTEITNQLMAEDTQGNQSAAQSEELKVKREEIFQEIKTELINRGQDGKLAEEGARVFAHAAIAQASMQNISVDEWMKKNKPTIVNGDEQVPLKFERKAIPQFNSDSIVHEDQVKTALKNLGLPETYQHPESISAIRAQLAFMQSEINQSEAGKRTFREGEIGSDQVVEGVKSTFPQWFRDGDFKTKKDFNKLISQGNSKNLGKLIELAVKALKEGHGENPQNAFAPNLDFVSLVDPDSLENSFQASQMMAQNKNEFYQSDSKNASVEFRADQVIVRLFKSANQSSFIHESGHIFLQSFYNHVISGDASNRSLRDWSKLSAWLDYNPAQTELTVEQHEKFARGFEQYLREGKAPSKGLQRTFRQFSKWLKRLYKSAKALDVELTPEVREVMDRMLATDDEIAIVRKQAGLETEIDLTDMPDGVKAKLETLRGEAEDKAFEQLFKDQMREISADHKEFLKTKEKEITKRIRAEIEASPEGAEYNDIRGALKTKDIVGYADKFLNEDLSEEKAVAFEMLGEEMGYSSGDHFAKAIKAMPSVNDMVQSQVQEEMKKYSTLNDKEMIREKARDVIHNEKSVELLALEKEILRKRLLEETESENEKIANAMEKADAVTLNKWLNAKEKHNLKKAFNEGLQKGNQKLEKELTRLSDREKERSIREDQKRLVKEFLAAKDDHERKTKIAEFRDSVNSLNRVIRSYTKSEAETVKSQAKEIISKKAIKEATRFTQYFTAERNAALRVARAISNNDWSAAIVAKQEQMLNHALAKESMRIKKEVSRHSKYLNDQRTASRDSFKNEDHHFQASKILDRFGFARSDFDPSFQGETLSQWSEKYDAMTNIVAIEDWLLDERINIKTNEMTIDQLREVRNAIQNIKQVANYESEISKLNGKQTSAEIAGDLIQESQINFDPKNRFKNKFEDTKFDKFKGWMRLYMFSLKKIETVVGPLGAWKDNSLWVKYFSGSVYDAANDESRMIQNATKELGKNWAIYTDKERKDIYNKKIFIPEFGGDVKTGVSLTKDRLLAMAHNLGNNGNRERLFATRPVGLDQSIPWGEGVVMAILQRELTAKDWAFVQANWNHLESYWPKIASLHKRLTGFTPGKVEHRKFSVLIKDGTKIDLEGGYYPLKSDPRNSFKDEVKDNADTPLYTEQNMAWKAATKKGHTKERVNAQYPVSLDLGIINRHLQDIIHDLAFRETVIELNKLIGREDMQAEMKATLTPEGYKAVKEYVGAVAGGQGGDPISAIDKTIKVLRQNTTKAALFWKVSVVTQNFANALIFPNAVEGFGYADAFKSYMKYGISDYTLKLFSSEGKEIREMVYEKSAFMKDRADSPDYSIEETHSKFSKNEVGEISKMAGGMMAWTDEFTNLPMWLGAYNKAKSEGKSEYDSVKFADTLIMRVAGSSRKYDVAAITRGTETQKIFSMFFSWLNTEHNRWMREMGIVTRDKDASRAIGFLAGRMVFQAAGAALMFKLPDPEDEDEVKKFLASITIGMPIGFFPGLRDVAGVAVDKAMGIKGFGYNPSPAFAGIDYGLKGFGAIVDVAQGNIDEKTATEKVSKAASYGFGYPDQFNQWFFNMYDYTEGMEPKLQDIYRRRPKQERR